MFEIYQGLPEGTLVQLIKNELVMSPSPLNVHQKVLDKIYRQIGDFVEVNHLGETRFAPFDVYLDKRNVFQPDVVFISNENLHKIEANGLHGAPDLVIEVLSPSTVKHDFGKKKDVYERYGVKEYWIIDPSTKSVNGFSIVNGVYEELEKSNAVLFSRLLDAAFKF